MFNFKKNFLFFSIILSLFAIFFISQYISLAFENPLSPPPLGGGYLQTQANQLLITKPVIVRSGSDFKIASGSLLDVGGMSKFYSRLQVLGDSFPTSGVGLELGYDPFASSGIISVFDRNLGAIKDLRFEANKFIFGDNLNPVLVIANNNVAIGTSSSNYALDIFRNNTSSVVSLSVGSSSNALHPKIVFRAGNPLQELFHLGVVYNSPVNYELKITTVSNLTTSESISITPQLDFRLGAGNIIMNKFAPQSIIKNLGSLNIQASNDIIFYSSNTQRMIVTRSGNIGINTASPTALLDVAGKGKFSELEVTGTMTIPMLFKSGSVNQGTYTVHYFCIQNFIVQWGEVTIDKNSSYSITLAKPYLNLSYNIQVSFKSESQKDRNNDPGVYQKSANSILLHNNYNNYDESFTWLTVGMGNCN